MTELTPDPSTTPDPTTAAGGPQGDAPGAGNSRTAPAAEGDTAPTQQSPETGTGSTGSPEAAPAGGYGPDGGDPGAVSDAQLPEDLRPTDDNPLAKPLDDDADQGLDLGAQL